MPHFIVIWVAALLSPPGLHWNSLPGILVVRALGYFVVDAFLVPRGMAPTLYLYVNDPHSPLFPYAPGQGPYWLQGRTYWVWRYVTLARAEVHKFCESDWERVEVWVRADGDDAGMIEWIVDDFHFRELWIPYTRLARPARQAEHRRGVAEARRADDRGATWVVEVDTDLSATGRWCAASTCCRCARAGARRAGGSCGSRCASRSRATIRGSIGKSCTGCGSTVATSWRTFRSTCAGWRCGASLACPGATGASPTGRTAKRMGPLGAAGLALTTAVASATNCVQLVVRLRRRVGVLGGRAIVGAAGRVGLACVPKAAWGIGSQAWWTVMGFASLPARVGTLVVQLGVAAVLFGLAAWLLRCEEFAWARDLFRRAPRGVRPDVG